MKKLNESVVAEVLHLIRTGKQPACVVEVKNTIAAKGPFVGYTTIGVERTTHLGTGETVYAVITTELVDTERRAQEYLNHLRRFGTSLDRTLDYIELLESIIRGREVEVSDVLV